MSHHEEQYPAARAARDRFIVGRRPARDSHDPWQYQDLIVEDELTDGRAIARTATVFLTGKECAWRCVMCDLWRYTTTSDTPAGAIPAQITAARSALDARGEAVSQLKLYNASNFFDPHAVPDQDYPAIAAALGRIDRVVVESHPALIGSRVDRFLAVLADTHDAHPPRLEVAMGLETANPAALERINKGLTVEQFFAAARSLSDRGVALRVFVLISPPFIPPSEQDRWLSESIDVAVACGAGVVSLIPARGGNGAIDALAADGLFRSPELDDIERGVELALPRIGTARLMVDLWNLEQFSRCATCFDARRRRLHTINLEQCVSPAIACQRCGHLVAASAR